MKLALIFSLVVLLLLITSCGGATGNVPRAPPQPSGGGCGIAAPISEDSASPGEAEAVEDGFERVF